jgi:hypothetical protein
MPNWLIISIVITAFIGVLVFCSWQIGTIVDEYFRLRSRKNLLRIFTEAFDRNVLTRERIKSLGQNKGLSNADVRLTVEKLYDEVMAGTLQRKTEADIKELENILKELDAEEPFQGLPLDLKAPLLRIRDELGSRKDIMDSLLGHLKEYSVKNERQKRRSDIIGIIGLIFAFIGLVLSLWPLLK